ncbi:MAG: cell division protein FtsZ, partial [Chloroflexota bacterium]
RARKAAESAISSGLLDVTIDGARGILFNITGGPNLSLFEVNEAAAIIKESAHPEVNLIFGAQIDENMGDELRITVIATGFEQSRVQRKMEAQLQPRQPARPVQQPVQQSQPRQPVQQQPTNLPPEQPYAPPQPRPAQQPPMQEAPREYDTDDIDIPTFLRKRK